MRAIGIGIPFFRRRSGVDAQAQVHYNRVIADGGVVPSGLSGVNAFFSAVKAIYGTSDINTAISAAYDAHYLGYKLGAGSGTTLGQAAQKLYSCSGASGDVVQTTAASQPLLLAHTGDNYWFGSGVAANLNTSNLQSAFNFGGDFSMVFDIKPLPTTSMEISGCLNSIFYSFAVMSTGVLRFNGGGQTISSTSGINTTIRQWVRISRSGNNWLFYTSLDGTTWTQLGTTVVNSVTLSGVSINIRVGEGAGGIASPFNGSIFRGLFYTDATLSTTRADFNPASYNPSVSQTQWSSATGEVWSISTGTAATGYKGQLTYKTTVLTDGIDDSMTSTMSSDLISTINNNHGVNFVAKRYINSNNQNIVRFAGDYADNNSSQIWFEGGNLFVNKSLKGTALVNQRTTGNYTLNQYFSYSESIVYGGTTTQRLNITNNSGTYFNNTTNKPAIVSGNMVLFSSSVIGILNGSFNTLIVTNNGTKFVEINDYMKQINNI